MRYIIEGRIRYYVRLEKQKVVAQVLFKKEEIL